MHHKSFILTGLGISLLGAVWFSQGVYIQAKAVLAQQLLQSAWQETLESRIYVKPWSWADTWPVARLTVASQAVDMIILEGASGSSLAFAPGHLQGTAAPGEPGISLISAHRDTHFSFLRHLKVGDSMRIQNSRGEISEYEVMSMAIKDARAVPLPQQTLNRGIMLVTCYPFDSLRAGGNLRYIVYATEKDSDIRSARPGDV